MKGNERDQKEGDRSTGTGTVHVFGGETENVTDKNRFFFFFLKNLFQFQIQISVQKSFTKTVQKSKSGVTILCHEITNHTVIFGPRSQGQNHLHEKL